MGREWEMLMNILGMSKPKPNWNSLTRLIVLGPIIIPISIPIDILSLFLPSRLYFRSRSPPDSNSSPVVINSRKRKRCMYGEWGWG